MRGGIFIGEMMDRRDFLKAIGFTAAGLIMAKGLSSALMAGDERTTPMQPDHNLPKVFFTRDISPNGLKRMYSHVNHTLSGKIALKLHTGEPNGPYIIRPETVREFMTVIPNATIVETNTFYNSPRHTTEGHRETLKINGWTFAPVDIMDEHGEINLPVPGGKWYSEIAMGKNLVNYDSMLVLTHFKGHGIGGFGGSLKNIAIGCASAATGKKQLHQLGDNMWGYQHERFMENMVESGKATTTYFGPKMAYINVLNNMSVDCDCTGTNAAPPTIPDVGIVASTDILAVDQASIDLVYSMPSEVNHDLVERIESRKGLRQLSYMDEMRMGSSKYELINLDEPQTS